MAIDLTDLIDLDLLAYFKSKLDLLFANKVDKETGKGLSTNDYTAAEKTKLAGIETGAQVNVLEGVQVNGQSITPTNKIANITTPQPSSTTPVMDGTAATGSETTFARGDHVHPSDNTKVDKETGKGLSTNDYTTAEKNKLAGIDLTAYYTKTEVDQMVSGVMNYKGTKATTSALPATGNVQGDVWHITADGSEWAWDGSNWQELGTTVDLSGYVEESELGLASTTDIDDMFT